MVTPPLLLSVGLATVQEGNNVREILLPGKRRFYLVGRCETLGVMAPMVSATEPPRVYTAVPDVCGHYRQGRRIIFKVKVDGS